MNEAHDEFLVIDLTTGQGERIRARRGSDAVDAYVTKHQAGGGRFALWNISWTGTSQARFFNVETKVAVIEEN